MLNECIFCKIIAGKIPCHKVYEDNNFLAFLDIAPRNPGHCLVIPKKHFRWVWDVPDIGEYFEVVRRIEKVIEKELKAKYVMSIVWGEEVPHAHVWLVPRFEGDNVEIKLGEIKKLGEQEMKRIAEKLRKALK